MLYNVLACLSKKDVLKIIFNDLYNVLYDKIVTCYLI